MLRRVHTANLQPGEVALDLAGSRHVRDVLRLAEGAQVEVFDDAGNSAAGTIVRLSPQVLIAVQSLNAVSDQGQLALTIASAVPKGERADWMIEKLSELGCARFIPLASARSVVLPEGRNKHDRWIRIATESAKQSRRRGVMQIGELTRLSKYLEGDLDHVFHLSTQPDAVPLAVAITAPLPTALTLLIGPEGGWTEEEITHFAVKQITGIRLTSTILRVETAAIAAAAVVMTAAALVSASNRSSQT